MIHGSERRTHRFHMQIRSLPPHDRIRYTFFLSISIQHRTRSLEYTILRFSLRSIACIRLPANAKPAKTTNWAPLDGKLFISLCELITIRQVIGRREKCSVRAADGSGQGKSLRAPWLPKTIELMRQRFTRLRFAQIAESSPLFAPIPFAYNNTTELLLVFVLLLSKRMQDFFSAVRVAKHSFSFLSILFSRNGNNNN